MVYSLMVSYAFLIVPMRVTYSIINSLMSLPRCYLMKDTHYGALYYTILSILLSPCVSYACSPLRYK